ncbi:MAG TPA: peptidase [Nitrospiraceae bacterium]|nr:peptidase [Nitrospiraceae bacterium]
MKRQLPAAYSGAPFPGIRFDLSPRALEKWNPAIKAASSDDNTITIFDVIGQDYWTGEGVTAKRIAGALRAIGDKPVTVMVNSPGGDMFEGLAIYSLLREHPAEVTVKVLGLAASAASIIAMAGDTVQVARAGFLMIHNAWIYAAGNRHEFREYADYLEPFDRSMADIYAARTGSDIKAMQKLMDAESWIGGSDAIDQGFADSLLASDEVAAGETSQARAAVQLDIALAKAGMPRSERKKLLAEYKVSTPCAGDNDTPCAISLNEELAELRMQITA